MVLIKVKIFNKVLIKIAQEEPEEQEEQVGQVDKDQDLLPTRPQSERIG